jgi:hypothetical protein
MHADDEDEREQDGCQYRGELLQRQDGDEQPGHAEQHARQQPTLCSGGVRVDHTMTLPPRQTSRVPRNK